MSRVRSTLSVSRWKALWAAPPISTPCGRRASGGRGPSRASCAGARARAAWWESAAPGDLHVSDGAPSRNPANVIYTVGHSTHPLDDFVSLLRGAGVAALGDV